MKIVKNYKYEYKPIKSRNASQVIKWNRKEKIVDESVLTKHIGSKIRKKNEPVDF